MSGTLRETFVQKHCTILAFENDQRITQQKDQLQCHLFITVIHVRLTNGRLSVTGQDSAA